MVNLSLAHTHDQSGVSPIHEVIPVSVLDKSNDLVYANLDFESNNDITETMNVLNDGGSVVTASPSNGSVSVKSISSIVKSKSGTPAAAVNNSNNRNASTPSSGNNKSIAQRSKPKAAKRASNSKASSQQQQVTMKQNVSLSKGGEKRNANSTEYASIAFSDKTDL